MPEEYISHGDNCRMRQMRIDSMDPHSIYKQVNAWYKMSQVWSWDDGMGVKFGRNSSTHRILSPLPSPDLPPEAHQIYASKVAGTGFRRPIGVNQAA